MSDLFNNWNAFNRHEEGTPHVEPVSSESADEVFKSTIDDLLSAGESKQEATPVVSEDSTVEKKSVRKKVKKSRKPTTSVELSDKVVRQVLGLSDQLQGASDSVRSLSATLLGVKDSTDDVRFIVALADSENVDTVKKSVREAIDLAEMDDLKFAVTMAGKSHAERKALWDLVSGVADSVPEGKFPQADVGREVSMLREVLSSGVSDKFTGVLELLA